MRVVLLLVALLSAALGAAVMEEADSRINGGYDIDIRKVPWQVFLLIKGLACGGVIISDHWVLTAGHCANGAQPSDATIRAGSNHHSSGGQEYKVDKVVVHTGFVFDTLTNDISALRTESPIKFAGVPVSVAQLPPRGYRPALSASLQVVGWGITVEGGSVSPVLKGTGSEVIPFATCQQTYPGNNPQESLQFCTRGVGGLNCQGDSGGSVAQGGVVVGLVSAANRPCGKGPGLIVNLGSYREWIKANTGV